MHASCVAIEGVGVLLRGPSGSGKSSLALALLTAALRLPDGQPGPIVSFVADDRVQISNRSGRLYAAPAAAIAGLIEVRGLGILRLPSLGESPLGLVCDLVAVNQVPRLPQSNQRTIINDVSLPQLLVDANQPLAATKIILRVAMLCGRLRALPD